MKIPLINQNFQIAHLATKQKKELYFFLVLLWLVGLGLWHDNFATSIFNTSYLVVQLLSPSREGAQLGRSWHNGRSTDSTERAFDFTRIVFDHCRERLTLSLSDVKQCVRANQFRVLCVRQTAVRKSSDNGTSTATEWTYLHSDILCDCCQGQLERVEISVLSLSHPHRWGYFSITPALPYLVLISTFFGVAKNLGMHEVQIANMWQKMAMAEPYYSLELDLESPDIVRNGRQTHTFWFDWGPAGANRLTLSSGFGHLHRNLSHTKSMAFSKWLFLAFGNRYFLMWTYLAFDGFCFVLPLSFEIKKKRKSLKYRPLWQLNFFHVITNL